MLAVMHEKLSAERRSNIARAAARERWRKDAPEKTRITLTVTMDDHATLEALRVQSGEVSIASMVRGLIRAAKEKLK